MWQTDLTLGTIFLNIKQKGACKVGEGGHWCGGMMNCPVNLKRWFISILANAK